MPDVIGSFHSFHATGASCRASGYGAAVGQNFPVPGPFALALPDAVTAPGFEHAARMAATLGTAAALPAERRRNSLREIPPGAPRRSRGCITIAPSPRRGLNGLGVPDSLNHGSRAF